MHNPLSGIMITPLATLHYIYSNPMPLCSSLTICSSIYPMLTVPVTPWSSLIFIWDLIQFVFVYKSLLSTHVLLSSNIVIYLLNLPLIWFPASAYLSNNSLVRLPLTNHLHNPQFTSITSRSITQLLTFTTSASNNTHSFHYLSDHKCSLTSLSESLRLSTLCALKFKDTWVQVAQPL